MDHHHQYSQPDPIPRQGEGPNQKALGIGEKIKILILGFLGIFASLISSFRLATREIRLNNRILLVQKQLGEGGFSFVYLVKDRNDGLLYALKRVNIELPEHEHMLSQEIKAYKMMIQSPNIIKLVDYKVVQNAGRTVEGLLLLPYYKNGTAQDLIDKGDISLQLVCNICIDICKALRAFHSQNLAFRDLKPANVLLDSHNRALLMDLGSVDVARVVISSRKEGIALQEHCAQTCTAPYRAPELFDPPSNCTITESTDIWSLGCCLYALVYLGQSPFDGSATAAMSGNISFPAKPNGHLFQPLMQQILQTNPSLRPSLDQIEASLLKLSSQTNFSSNSDNLV